MCTTILQTANDGSHVFSRTMDWKSLQAGPIFVPRDFKWQSDFNNQNFKNKYAILGTGKKRQFEIDISDGINERGLSVQKLTFSHGAILDKKLSDNHIGLAPFELPFYLLGMYGSVIEVLQNIADIQLMVGENAVRKYENPHLHYALTDETGRFIILEPNQSPLKVIENNYGVVTNAVNFANQVQQLADYLNVRSDLAEQKMLPQKISDGSFAAKKVPTSAYTPTGRFLRAVYYRERADVAQDETENIISSWHILNSVVVPKSKSYQTNYTVYRVAYGVESRRYFFESYNSLRPIQLRLTNEMAMRKSLKIYEIADRLSLD